ncbi:F-box only protein 17 isoform X1 [Halichoerus grypus]|uniref:F-box only protein 17 isoform X1 n=1 Tax=Halichoerus grypus TaxID=9711 RepID=UPI001659606A|nr:F-box only protein 17 isoform X1 [Halichoerus grypus]XP_035950829.1 F-box only protein 17 isoform X1 [Halichoerus grypus]
MGARPSRRRLPADPPLALDALPPELLVQVLSHVPPRALVTRCRAVCRAWRDVVDGPTVWLLQLARDRSAEGRALYAVAQRCPPNSEDEEFPLCALARYCLRAPLGRNLIFNSCGEQGFRGWEVEHGGNGWAVEKNLTLVPGAPSQTCFVTSFQWCFKRQLVDLVMEGVWQELLDSAQIEICVADWWGARENCGCIYRLRVRLLDVYENEVVKFSASPNPVLQWTERGCRQVGLDCLPDHPTSHLLRYPSQPSSWLEVSNSNSQQPLNPYFRPGTLPRVLPTNSLAEPLLCAGHCSRCLGCTGKSKSLPLSSF